MLKDANLAAKEQSSSMMEDFGRFSPVETLSRMPILPTSALIRHTLRKTRAPRASVKTPQ